MHEELRGRAEAYARVALANIEREFPHHEAHPQSDASPIPRPRELHPAFYGSLDWHSCVEMHWVLARLLRVVPTRVPEGEIRAALDTHLSAEAVAGEVRFFENPANRLSERPYGWAWALRLAAEAGAFDSQWAKNVSPLADLFVERFLEWLPKVTYPFRPGLHGNTAFAFSLLLPFAQAHNGALLDAVNEAASRWYGDDAAYAAEWEPSDSDFLSPALTEAELMSSLLPDSEFPAWLERFLPGIANGEPMNLFTPAVVSDPTDGYIAHLHGLNLSRAWCFKRLAAALPAADRRVPVLHAAAQRHAEASLDAAVGSHYAVEHWLPAYAVLYLSD